MRSARRIIGAPAIVLSLAKLRPRRAPLRFKRQEFFNAALSANQLIEHLRYAQKIPHAPAPEQKIDLNFKFRLDQLKDRRSPLKFG